MKLTKETYTISCDTIEKVLAALGRNWFYDSDDGESYNNEDVIEADELLQAEVKAQEES